MQGRRPFHHAGPSSNVPLSVEGFREPIERFETALQETPERIALREIGETFPCSPRRELSFLCRGRPPWIASMRTARRLREDRK